MDKLTADQGVFVYFKAIIFNLLAQLVLGIVISVVPVETELMSTLQIAFMAVLQLAFYLAVRSSVARHGRLTGYGIAPVKWWIIPLALVCAPACVLAFVFPANMFQVFLESFGYTSHTSIDLGSNLNICLATFVTVILAPVCEEYVFRGALLGGLVKKHGVFVSCLMSAAAFSLMHMNPEQTVYQFCLGFVAAYFTICSRSLLPSIVLHGGNNLIAILLEVFPIDDGGGVTYASGSVIAATAIFLGGVAAFYFAGRLIARVSGGFKGMTDAFRVENLADEKAAEDALSGETDIVCVCRKCGAETTEKAKKCPNCGGKTYRKTILPPIMGKRTVGIVYGITIGICAFMWIVTFVSCMI